MQFPKLYQDVTPHNRDVRAFFAAALSGPVVICGNGPSSARPFRDGMPTEATFFRMNWFFLEEAYHYGRRVDGFFWSVDTPPLQEALARLHQGKEYEIRSFFSPMHVRDQGGRDPVRAADLGPLFDHWAVIAENPTLARELMGRPLPTQGFQVLAFALALGFRDVYLSGIDLYESTTQRYPYAVPPAIANALKAKDTRPGYEDKHSKDRDLSFYQTCRAQFPDASVTALSDSAFLREFTDPRPAVHVVPALPISEAKQSPGRGGMTLRDGRRVAADEIPTLESDQYSRSVDGHKCAFVTLLAGGGFEPGVKVLSRSLAAVSDIPLVVMCAPEADTSQLANESVVLYDVEPIENPNALDGEAERFRCTYTKLNVFGLPHWDRLVFLDADTVVLKNIDELFQISEFAAAPDLGMDLYYDRFNSGVFCCQPSPELFADLLDKAQQLRSYDSGDQGFLNEYFRHPRFLDPGYNTLKRLYSHHPNLFRWDDVRVIHYVGQKPWQTLAGVPEYEELERIWFRFVSTEEMLGLLQSQKARLRAQRAPKTPFGRKLRKLRRRPLRFLLDSKARPVAELLAGTRGENLNSDELEERVREVWKSRLSRLTRPKD